MGNRGIYVKIITVVSFIVMLAMNIISNVLPINGMTTGEISDSYPNLLTPAGYTFSIWALIYLLLFAFTFYQLDLFHKRKERIKQEVLNQIRILFIVSSFSNTGWILAWHYDFMALSVMLSAIMLVCLIYINRALSLEDLSKKEKIMIRLPFSIYYGWITVATVANVSILLVSIRWKGFGLPESFWTIVILVIILLITSYRTQQNKDPVYGLTIIWGYIGVLVKHISKFGLDGKYPEIIGTIIICIILLVTGEGYLYLVRKKHS